ncbi:DMT family transporter [Jatrophihabitans sp.]|uniref:DMT family transporter n=1 Tax=Jatrophihabitans sp. TaxID=1932789 RepID=UPI0030C72791|nr:hypothetical protein [Jatrophihabitans sp.]
MVYLAGILAALALGLGWVLQQRVASHAAASELMSLHLVWHLMGKRVWWAGIAAMVAGQALGAWALQLGTVTLVEPLLSVNLLFAFIIASAAARHRPRPSELIGAAVLSAALGVFIAIGRPRSGTAAPTWQTIALATVVIALVVAAILRTARRRGLIGEAVLIATSAGILYGLQDAATRGALLRIDHHGIATLLTSSWPYIVVGAAVVGIALSQNAFGAARLDYSLPPTAAAEPIVGVLLGVALLGDRLAVTDSALAIEATCLVAMVLGAVLIGRSPALGLKRQG